MIRSGLVTGLKVEPYESGAVLPHEETLSKPKADRLQLMRATRSNFSSIFGLYSDPDQAVVQLLRGEIKKPVFPLSILSTKPGKPIDMGDSDRSIIDRWRRFPEKQLYCYGLPVMKTLWNMPGKCRNKGSRIRLVLTTLVNNL